MNDYFVTKWLNLFTETGNPIFAFRAYQNARRLRQPLPEKVLRYFDGVVKELLSIAADPPTPKDRPHAIANAWGLSRSGGDQHSEFTDYSRREQDRKMAVKTYFHITEFWGEGKRDYAFGAIAESYKISKSTVRRNYLKHLEAWTARAEKMIKTGQVVISEDGKPTFQTDGQPDDLRETAVILSLIENHLSK
jgi:hypothetical protein